MSDEDTVMAADTVVESASTIIPPPGNLAEFLSLSGPEAQLAIIERLDEYQQQIMGINKRVLELKAFYNVAVTTFHKLPSEILIHIFRQIDPSSCQDIQLSHVCHLWRSAIHQAPEFWARILNAVSVIEHPHGLHFFETFVERTAQLPFGISLNSGSLTVIQRLPSHHRLRVTLLSITFSHDYRADLLGLVDIELPNLQHLECDYQSSGDLIGYSDARITSAQTSKRLPYLRILHTHSFCATPALMVSSLRELRIFGPGVVSRRLILKGLLVCPRLEMLTIDNVQPDSELITTAGPPVRLEKLKELTLRSSQGQGLVGLFLSRLRYPPTTQIDIVCLGRLLSPYLCHGFPLSSPTPATSTIQSLKIIFIHNQSPGLSSCEIQGASDVSPNRLSMTLRDTPWHSFRRPQDYIHPLLTDIPHIFSAAHVQTLTTLALSFQGNLSASEDNWEVVLCALPHIRHFATHIACCRSLLCVFQSHPLLPLLSTLSITCEDGSEVHESLALAIEGRANMGSLRLEELHFYTYELPAGQEGAPVSPPFSATILERLKAHVREIYWSKDDVS